MLKGGDIQGAILVGQAGGIVLEITFLYTECLCLEENENGQWSARERESERESERERERALVDHSYHGLSCCLGIEEEVH